MKEEALARWKFARYAEIMPYYTTITNYILEYSFARYAEIMPYYTPADDNQLFLSLLGMLK